MASPPIGPNYRLTITKSPGGRSAHNKHHNVYHYQTSAPLDDDLHIQIINHYVNAERIAHYNQVDFLNAHVKRIAHTPTEFGINGDFRQISLDGTGSRTTTSILMPPQACLSVFRTPTLGHSGRMSYRGCLSVNDVDRTPQGDFILKRLPPTGTPAYQPLPAWVEDFKAALNLPMPGDSVAVMPDDPVNVLDYSRKVNSYVGGELTFRQTNNKRRSPDQALYEGAKAEVHDIERKLIKLAKGAAVAAIDKAYRPTVLALGLRMKEIIQALPPDKQVELVLRDVGRELLALNQAT
jgi:hypothetical protein